MTKFAEPLLPGISDSSAALTRTFSLEEVPALSFTYALQGEHLWVLWPRPASGNPSQRTDMQYVASGGKEMLATLVASVLISSTNTCSRCGAQLQFSGLLPGQQHVLTGMFCA